MKFNEVIKVNFRFFTILAVAMLGAIPVRAENYSAAARMLMSGRRITPGF